ncbi:MAG: polyprenyl synthetase family protein [Prevotellaceae bacterium]|jgi:geranylgeranyl pyrophosphate synthase|nr:polyprenyl synthetase family protein [Prevotellaceae bacterium]
MDRQQYTVPQVREERTQVRRLIDEFVGRQTLTPPLSEEILSRLSDRLIDEQSLNPAWKAWMMVELHNRVWRSTIAAIPADKRILLLPKCLSNTTHCRAEVDELGLLCHRCLHCTIPTLQDRADELGSLSLVAEGFTAVIPLIENRVVDAVIGVGCLDSLEKAFPLLINHAVPGLAVPLNRDGCRNTTVDTDYVEHLLTMCSDEAVYLLDYDYLKSTIKKWFRPESLAALLTPTDDPTSHVARSWLGDDGKRWRPYLLAATYLALSHADTLPREVQLAAVAVECFHKASLVHDDIQDNDRLRYGKPTVHAQHGVPMAINVGDMLLGEGYRLLAATQNGMLMQLAADAHIALCKGQGMELAWNAAAPHTTDSLTMDFVLDIFLHKTVPAFEVALVMGAVCAGADPSLLTVLRRYTRALGIAYQLHDDLEDVEKDTRPTAILAARREQADADEALPNNAAIDRVRQMADHYHREALEALNELANVELKRLLFRITQRILKS